MRVALAYLTVVMVWSTTPLAIQISNTSLSFVSAISIRMLFAFLICYGILKSMGKPLIRRPSDWLAYGASALGLFPNMLLIYWAAQHLSSGLMSVLMAFYPFCAGLFSWIILKDNPFTLSRSLALLIAVLGLVLINIDQLKIGNDAFMGVLCLMTACVVWGVSSVWVKKMGADFAPMQMGAGSVGVSLPFFLIAWLIIDGEVPQVVELPSLLGVSYLVIVGSVISHPLYFYILRHCTVSTVSLVTLITPIMAIAWGVLFLQEQISQTMFIGAALILMSLAVYQGVVSKLYVSIAKLFTQSRAGSSQASALSPMDEV